MVTGIEKKLVTAQDLAELPSGMGVRYELIEGELIEMSPSGGKHGYMTLLLGYFFNKFLFENPIGQLTGAESGFTVIQPNTVRAPDIAFIPNERIPEGGIPDGYLDIVPSLIVEVVSPNDKVGDVETKTKMWLSFGVIQVWNVYPGTKQVQVFYTGGSSKLYQGDDAVPGGEILPGFELALKDIFQH